MERQILGVMSGSSLDGLDLAIVRFCQHAGKVKSWDIMATQAVSITEEWLQTLPDLVTADSTNLLKAHAGFGKWIGQMCQRFLQTTGHTVDCIASHGHTVMHHPANGFSFQLGNGSHIAAVTGIPAMTDFRNADIAAGGQGAPLAPVAEKYLFPGHEFYLNLGGIANLSVFHLDAIRAWDVCPCNQILNQLARTLGMSYDQDGKQASLGVINEPLLKKLQSILPVPIQPAHSLDNRSVQQQWFPVFNQSSVHIQDKLRTATEYIADAIATQIRAQPENPGATVFTTGGGAHNAFLVDRIRELSKVKIVLPEQRIIDFKEAVLMALCGFLRLNEQPNAFGSATGARANTVNGTIHLPPA